MAKKTIEYEIRAKDGATANLKNMGLSADQTARKLKELEKIKPAADKGKGKEKGFDADSIVGEDRQINKLLQGGAAGLIGDQLAKASDKVVELSAQFRKGQIDASGLAVKI